MSEDVNTQGTRTTKRAIMEIDRKRKKANKRLKKDGLPQVSRSRAFEIAAICVTETDLVEG